MPARVEIPPLQVLIIERDDDWIAQGIQRDISATADTLEDVLYEFERAVVGHYYLARQRGLQPFENMPPAPEECVELWKSGYASISHTAAFRLVSEVEEIEARPEYRIATSRKPRADSTLPTHA